MTEFEPVNDLETQLRTALIAGDQEEYLRLLSAADLMLPADLPVGTEHGESAWATMVSDGRTFVVAYTSPAAMTESTTGQFVSGRTVAFRDLVAGWPVASWSLAIDPGLSLAAHLPASLIRQMAGGEFGAEPAPASDPGPDPGAGSGPEVVEPDPRGGFDPAPRAAGRSRPGPGNRPGPDDAATDVELVPTVMQKVVPPAQVSFYLDKGYDWVAGYVHRWQDAAELETAPDIVANLGLGYPGSPFSETDDSVYVLRWTAYRATLYRPPLGAVDEAGLAEVPGGWVIEHPPFTGTGHVSQSRLTIPEYKIDSIRLPHQAEMWRIGADGGQDFVAVYDADEQRWQLNRELVEET